MMSSNQRCSMAPRSPAARRRQESKARCAAATARSVSGAPRAGTAAEQLLSGGIDHIQGPRARHPLPIDDTPPAAAVRRTAAPGAAVPLYRFHSSAATPAAVRMHLVYHGQNIRPGRAGATLSAMNALPADLPEPPARGSGPAGDRRPARGCRRRRCHREPGSGAAARSGPSHHPRTHDPVWQRLGRGDLPAAGSPASPSRGRSRKATRPERMRPCCCSRVWPGPSSPASARH